MTAHVLITGGAGFIGTHLARRLIGRGDRVQALDDLSAPSALGLPASPACRLRIADVRARADVADAVGRADLVLHLASVVGVDAVTADPARTDAVIREGTACVLDACLAHGRPLVFFSTSEVTDGPRHGPRAVYGDAKRDAEALLLDHADRVPVTIVRPFNIVGPGQSAPGMVLPTLARAARAGRPLPVHGDGEQLRSFLHVDDLVEATLALLEHAPATGGEIVEIGSEQQLSIGQLAERLAHLGGRSARVRRGARAPDREDRPRRSADLASLRRRIPFAPRWSLDAILQEAITHA